MKIAFVSNYFNHHQRPLSDALFELCNGQYVFISTERMTTERKSLGYGEKNIPEYVKYTYESAKEAEECQDYINNADVVLYGSAPYSVLKTRLKNGKLTFKYSERPYKKGISVLRLPLYLLRAIKDYGVFKNFYLLCASAYASFDFSRAFSFIGKAYKWGYFPVVMQYENIDNLILEKKKSSILWVARFIDWKHPELALEIAKRLKFEGYDFKLTMIGNGELLDSISDMSKQNGLDDVVDILGSMKPEQVREHMEKSEIFIFTSDRNEGWGAVLNESMNSACAVVANSAIGSVPFLIKDGENGYMYKDGDIDDLFEKVKKLLDNADERKLIAKNAYKTMVDEWNAENAAKKFVTLCEKMFSGEYKPFPYESGVCSKAEILKDNWYK